MMGDLNNDYNEVILNPLFTFYFVQHPLHVPVSSGISLHHLQVDILSRVLQLKYHT